MGYFGKLRQKDRNSNQLLTRDLKFSNTQQDDQLSYTVLTLASGGDKPDQTV